MTLGGVEADEAAEDNVVAGDAPADEIVEKAEVDAGGAALLSVEIGKLDADDGEMALDEGTLVKEATVLDVICMTDGVLDATVLLNVAVAVQNSCGTTL